MGDTDSKTQISVWEWFYKWVVTPRSLQIAGFYADCLPDGQKEGGVSCKQDAESAQRYEGIERWCRVERRRMKEELEQEIQKWGDEWVNGRWVENKPRLINTLNVQIRGPSCPSSCFRSRLSTVLNCPMALLSLSLSGSFLSLSGAFLSVSQFHPLSLVSLSSTERRSSMFISDILSKHHRGPSASVRHRQKAGINIACCFYGQQGQVSGHCLDWMRSDTAVR